MTVLVEMDVNEVATIVSALRKYANYWERKEENKINRIIIRGIDNLQIRYNNLLSRLLEE